MRRGSLAGAAALMATLVLGACGSADDKRDGGSGAGDDDFAVGALLDRVPGEATQIIAMDMAAAKRELGVAADLDPEGYRRRQILRTPEAKFDNAALKIVGYVTGIGKTPITEGIDHGAITAAVHAFMVGAGGELKIYKTSQSRESLDSGLRKAGLRATGDGVYVVEKPRVGTTLTAVALGDDGLVVVGETPDVALGVVRRSEPDPRLAPMRRLLEIPRGALRVASSHVKLVEEEAPCVRRVAGGEMLTAGNEDEDLALELSGVPRASEVVLGTSAARKEFLYRAYRVGDVARDGQYLTIKVRTPVNGIANDNAATLADSADLDLLYRCPGPAAARARAAAQTRRDAIPDPTPPDRTGSALETKVSAYIAAGSLAPPPAVRVRCPVKLVPRSVKVLRCKGTRRYKGRLYHYTIKVNFDYPQIESLDVDTPDDETGDIVTKDDKPSTSKKPSKPTE